MTDAQIAEAADRMVEQIYEPALDIYASGVVQAMELQANGADEETVARWLGWAEEDMAAFVCRALDGWEDAVVDRIWKATMDRWEREGGGDE